MISIGVVRWAASSTLLALLVVGMRNCSNVDADVAGTKQGWTHTYIQIISEGLNRFHKDMGRWPSTQEGLNVLFHNKGKLQAWKGPYINRTNVPVDRWGQPFIYRFPATLVGRTFDLYSVGPNGQDDGGRNDDIL